MYRKREEALRPSRLYSWLAWVPIGEVSTAVTLLFLLCFGWQVWDLYRGHSLELAEVKPWLAVQVQSLLRSTVDRKS